MEQLNNIGFMCLMAMQSLKNVKSGNTPLCIAKYKFIFEKQFYTACAEYDEYYHENEEDILWEMNKK